MTQQDLILGCLNGRSAQLPMSFGELTEKTGIPALPLMEVLQDLFDARAINRATITRDCLTYVVVWPTGMPAKMSFKQFTINPKKLISAEYKPTAQADNSIPQSEEHIMEPVKNKAQVILELLAERGKATGRELIAASHASSVRPFIKNHIDLGLIVVDGDYSNKIYSLAPGVTREELLSDRRRKTAKLPNALPDTSMKPTPADHVADASNMIKQPESSPTCAGIGMDTLAPPRFRLARTSDKTIMLFGLATEPIELDLEQTQLLINFMSSESHLCA
ncbi:hypothetical protein EBAPG3_010365 [Nitrosospira lacus]|uniref:Uncharacterized protein n=1 Tax=Nitrosospira lacus TaxID=1288494 RepID=A0A1W6SQU2_9PROT|nr:hypothetical protein [Nitrosospira lacus]ARO88145.1 hypothetical protein EBAPG3_010365 [Nitrosospira lacus]